MKRRITSGLSALLIGAMTIIGGALATREAHADPIGPGVPRSGPHIGSGLPITVAGQTYGTYLYGVDSGDPGERLTAYCVDFHNSYAPGVPLTESPRTDFGAAADADGSHIGWILHHSYPLLTLSEVETASALTFHDGLSAAEAITAAQAAIWLFSDGIALGTGQVTGSPAQQSDVAALYGYLTGAANTGIAPRAEPVLRLESGATADGTESPIGPITVTTSAEFVTLDATEFAGATLVDADGAPIDSAVDGDQVYVAVPADAAGGVVTVTATTLAQQQDWRLFAPALDSGPVHTQKLAVATIEELTLRAQLAVTWTPPVPASPPSSSPPSPPSSSLSPSPPLDSVAPAPPAAVTTAPVTRPVGLPQTPATGDTPNASPQLAHTGFDTTQSLFVAGAMILGGIAISVAGRRRRT